MAVLAHEVMVEAERTFRFAPVLAEAMEPHLLLRISESRIYGYTNERENRNVPPGDVLLAAAKAAGISIDQKLGLVAEPRDADLQEMRAQLRAMQGQIADLQRRLTGPETTTEPAAVRADRAAQRRAWARRSQAAGRADEPVPDSRRRGRTVEP